MLFFRDDINTGSIIDEEGIRSAIQKILGKLGQLLLQNIQMWLFLSFNKFYQVLISIIFLYHLLSNIML